MGLDMYFFSTSEVPEDVTDNDLNQGKNQISKYHINEVQYFRKHADLHGFLDDVYHEKGYTDEFNCCFLEITPAIVDKIWRLSTSAITDHAQGFFWGESCPSDWEETREMCDKLYECFKNKQRVFYYSWW